MEIDTRSPESPPAASQGKSTARGAGDGQDGAALSPFLALLAALQPASGPAPVAAEEVVAETPATEAVPLVATGSVPLVQEPVADVLPAGAGAPGQGARNPGAEVLQPAAESDMQAAAADPLATAARKSRPAAMPWQPEGDGAAAKTEALDETRQLHRQAQVADLQAATDGTRDTLSLGSTHQAVAGAAALAEAWGGAGRSPQAARAAERHAERASQPVSTLAMGSGGSDVPVQSNGAAMAPTAASALVPAGAGAAATLAEKMRFWSARGIQNASLELEAFDGAKVDVHIAMQGREAKVEFRSDVPEARRWLQEALPQLEDMFQGEGLVLAGGFVGAGAGQGDGGAAPRGDGAQQGLRVGLARGGVAGATAALADAQALRQAASPGSGRNLGHSVDLFV